MGDVESSFPVVELGPALPCPWVTAGFRVSAAALGLIWPWREPKLSHLTLCLSFRICSGSLPLGSGAVTCLGTPVQSGNSCAGSVPSACSWWLEMLMPVPSASGHRA